MTFRTAVAVGLALLTWPGARGAGQGLGVSVTFAGRADSIFRSACQDLRDRHYSITHVDSVSFAVDAQSADSPHVQVHITVQPLADSATVKITTDSPGARRAALLAVLDISAAMRPAPAGPRHGAPDGTGWPTDASGRVGFVVITTTGAKGLEVQPGDTLPEVRAVDLPPSYRHAWEDWINRVEFDPSCARFFRAGARFLVRFNMCATPAARLDRLMIYNANGTIYASVTGPTVGSYFDAMCPAARPPWPPLADAKPCPSPFATAAQRPN